jgi:hypothetical protein
MAKFDVSLPDVPADPPTGSAPAMAEARYQKQLDVAQTLTVTRKDTEAAVENARTDAQTAVTEARIDADRAAETALFKSIHDAYIQVIQGTLDRSVTRAQFLTGVIGAVSTTYTTLLGINFAVAHNQPAPGRALIPVVFLGLALVLAGLYVSFLHRTQTTRQLLPSGIGGTIAEDRLKTFMEWTFTGVLARAWALRGALVAFAVGIALIPLPFVKVSHTTETVYVLIVSILPLVLWAVAELATARRLPGEPSA